MKKYFNNLTTNKKLALAAVLLGAAALFSGNIYDDASATINNKELAMIVENKVDHVLADELADWIIKGKSDYRLIDLNDAAKFEEYHIPTAENILITDLAKADLMKNEKILLYSDGGIHAAQAWMLMKTKGYKSVYTLFGGLEEWKDAILFPSLPAGYTPQDSLLFEKKKQISLYFGGTPQSGTNTSVNQPTMQMPKMQTPAGGTGGTAPKKKKKEGC